MPTIKYKELKRRYELDGPEKTVHHLSEALSKNELTPEDFSIRDLAESMVPDGREWVDQMSPKYGSVPVTESTDGIDVTAFMNITGQLIYNKILESYRGESFVLSKAVTTIPTRLDGERIPGVGAIRDEVAEIHPGMPYPNLGFGEDYIDTPSTTKRGLIVPVTREAIFFDRTHLILSRAAEVGEILALNKEKRIADMILGLTSLYKWRGTTYSTYYSGSQSTDPWANLLASNELVDESDVDSAENLFANMLDPNTDEPVLIEPDTVLVMPAKRYTANEIFQNQKLVYSNGNLRSVGNPFKEYRVLCSRIAWRQLLATDPNSETDLAKYWFMGNFSKAFAYMENWPITVTHSARGSEADFNQDIVVRYKASERGTPAVLNPRYVVKCTG